MYVEPYRLSEEELLDCLYSQEKFCNVFLPHRFPLPFSDLIHKPLFRLIDDNSIRKVSAMMPRGIGKSSIVSFAYPLRAIVFQLFKYICIFSYDGKKAIELTEDIKLELRTNEMILMHFGNLIDGSISKGKEQYITTTGIKILPRGGKQQIRGANFGGARPDLIIPDDYETVEECRSEVRREYKRQLLKGDIEKSIDLSNPNWRIFMIGTPLHEGCIMLQNKLKPDWVNIQAELCDDSIQSLWPEQVTTEFLRQEYSDHLKTGDGDLWYRERRCKLIDPKTACFKPSYFRHYDEGARDFYVRRNKLENIVLVDPAKTQNPESCESAVVGVGIDCAAARIYVRDVASGKVSQNELFKEIFTMCRSLGARSIGIEVTSLHMWITKPLKDEIIRQRLPYEVIELRAAGDKVGRVRGLIPYYRNGQIYHNQSVCMVLESQLLNFPDSKLWDVMDAFAYIIPMMVEGGRYFEPPGGEDGSAWDHIEEDLSYEVEEDQDLELAAFREGVTAYG